MSTPAANVPPPRKEEGLRGIFAVLLAVLAVALVLIFSAVYFGGRYLARNVNINVRERGDQKTVQIQTPGGEVNINASKEGATKPIDLPIYPGALRRKKGASLSIDLPHEGGKSMVVQAYETPDPVDRVVEWYRQELGPKFSMESGHGRKGEAIVFQSEDKERHRLVAIKSEGNVTQIVLTVVGEKEPI